MKKLIVILTLGFLVGFSGTSQAFWGRYGYYRGFATRCYAPRVYAPRVFAPRVIVIGHPCYNRVWYPGYWGWNRWHQRIWVGGYWR